jgi:hypothetical protein
LRIVSRKCSTDWQIDVIEHPDEHSAFLYSEEYKEDAEANNIKVITVAPLHYPDDF